MRFFPTKNLGRRFLECKLVSFFSHKKFREKALGMEACEIFSHKNLGRRFLEWKLVRFLSHKKFRGKVPGMETCEIFSHTKMKRNRFLECKLLR